MSGSPRSGTRFAQVRHRAERVAVRLEQTPVGRLWSRSLEVEFVDRSVALAAKAFVSFFPLLIIISALTPTAVRDELLITFVNRFGLAGGSLDVVRQGFASADQTRAATGIFGVLLTLAFAVSFTTALQRIFLRAWRRPPGGGARNKGRGAIWLGGVLGLFGFLSGVRAVLVGLPGSLAVWSIGLAGTIVMWWWTARIMLRGEVRWRPLLPSAVVNGVASWVYTLAASVWMPRTLAQHYEQFGAFGISLAFVSWFTGFAFIVVLSAVVGPVLSEGDDRLARWLRGPSDTVLVPGAPQALPGPSRPIRLSDAFGRGSSGAQPYRDGAAY